MPAPAATPRNPKFVALREESASWGESNDCAVVAVAAATNTPYGVVRTMMLNRGRRSRHGTPIHIIESVIHALGYRIERVNAEHFIDQYPGAHKNAKHVTSHHPQRYNRVWADGQNYLMYVSGFRHVLAVCDGQNVDWTVGRAFRAAMITRIVKA
jgi:cellobiose phosphorylase